MPSNTKPTNRTFNCINWGEIDNKSENDLNKNLNGAIGAWSPKNGSPGTSQDFLKKSNKSSDYVKYWPILSSDGYPNTFPKSNRHVGTIRKLPIPSDKQAKTFILDRSKNDTRIRKLNNTTPGIGTEVSDYNKNQSQTREKHDSTYCAFDNETYKSGLALNSDLLCLSTSNFKLSDTQQNPQYFLSRKDLTELLLQDLKDSDHNVNSGNCSLISEKYSKFHQHEKAYEWQPLSHPLFKKSSTEHSPPPLPLRHSKSGNSTAPPKLPPKPARLRASNLKASSTRQSRNLVAENLKPAAKRKSWHEDSGFNALIQDELQQHLQHCRCLCNHLGIEKSQVGYNFPGIHYFQKQIFQHKSKLY